MQAKIDDGEIEMSDNGMLPNPASCSSFQDLVRAESFLDDITRTCTHTHTCNPPGPDSAHTHTCFHTHTQVLTSEDDHHHNNKKHFNLKRTRPSGNREAVRKYREKKKAHIAYLEEEVKKLQLLNQQLVKKLQGQAALEAEVLRLRSILMDLRGKIDIELGDFPLQKHCNSATAFKEGHCTRNVLQCQTDLPCFHPHTSQGSVRKVKLPWDGNCQHSTIDCPSAAEALCLDTVDTLVSSASQAQ